MIRNAIKIFQVDWLRLLLDERQTRNALTVERIWCLDSASMSIKHESVLLYDEVYDAHHGLLVDGVHWQHRHVEVDDGGLSVKPRWLVLVVLLQVHGQDIVQNQTYLVVVEAGRRPKTNSNSFLQVTMRTSRVVCHLPPWISNGCGIWCRATKCVYECQH